MTDGDKKKNRAPLFIGIGCLALISLSCCCGGGAYAFVSGRIADSATAHANEFLVQLENQNYAMAYSASRWEGDFDLHSAEQFRSCLQATPLGDMTSHTCDDADVDLGAQDADVTCTVQSVSQGTQVVTVHVNSPTESPYLGFLWFSPGVRFGPAWSQDDCTAWSGREFVEEPPSGRVRPGTVGYGQ